jgi:hypothetical protein
MPDTICYLAKDPTITKVRTVSRFSNDESERNPLTGLLEQTLELRKKVSSYSVR